MDPVFAMKPMKNAFSHSVVTDIADIVPGYEQTDTVRSQQPFMTAEGPIIRGIPIL